MDGRDFNTALKFVVTPYVHATLWGRLDKVVGVSAKATPNFNNGFMRICRARMRALLFSRYASQSDNDMHLHFRRNSQVGCFFICDATSSQFRLASKHVRETRRHFKIAAISMRSIYSYTLGHSAFISETGNKKKPRENIEDSVIFYIGIILLTYTHTTSRYYFE